jgi:hypothetical protein
MADAHGFGSDGASIDGSDGATMGRCEGATMSGTDGVTIHVHGRGVSMRRARKRGGH